MPDYIEQTFNRADLFEAYFSMILVKRTTLT